MKEAIMHSSTMAIESGSTEAVVVTNNCDIPGVHALSHVTMRFASILVFLNRCKIFTTSLFGKGLFQNTRFAVLVLIAIYAMYMKGRMENKTCVLKKMEDDICHVCFDTSQAAIPPCTNVTIADFTTHYYGLSWRAMLRRTTTCAWQLLT
jgi:hypothetical protein